jgi:hypothetical protein
VEGRRAIGSLSARPPWRSHLRQAQSIASMHYSSCSASPGDQTPFIGPPGLDPE